VLGSQGAVSGELRTIGMHLRANVRRSGFLRVGRLTTSCYQDDDASEAFRQLSVGAMLSQGERIDDVASVAHCLP
jgi:hypothetical protein